VVRRGLQASGGVWVGSLAGRLEPLEVLADSVGPDVVGSAQGYPLNFRRLQGFGTRERVPIANGYCHI
jgi:hypothetical protein